METKPARPVAQAAAFRAGALVLVTLNTPREKFWGAVLEITPAGVSIRGLDLNSFDDFARLLRAGEPATPGMVFFPMHRVERMELDARNGDIPSLRERFEEKTGVDIAASLGVLPDPGVRVGSTLAEARRLLIAATLEAVEGDVARAARMLDLSEDELRSWLAR
ncbi:MAG: hypothetical protein ACRD2Q_11750 [Terriglobales bacterium]